MEQHLLSNNGHDYVTEYPVEKSLHCGGWVQQKKAAVKELMFVCFPL